MKINYPKIIVGIILIGILIVIYMGLKDAIHI